MSTVAAYGDMGYYRHDGKDAMPCRFLYFSVKLSKSAHPPYCFVA